MQKHFSVILIAILIGITAYSIFSFVATVKEKYDLVTDLEEIRQEVDQLEADKEALQQEIQQQQEVQESLTQENGGLKDQLQVSAETLAKVQEALQVNIEQTTKEIDDLNAQMFVVKAENKALLEQVTTLKQDVVNATQEKSLLEAKIGSIDSLKQMIRDLRRKTRRTRAQSSLTFIKDTKEEVSEIVIGNKGFLVRDGRNTFPAKVKIEVQPSPR